MVTTVTIAVAPLWASHVHLLKEFAHISELATNPEARPDAYTATQSREDKKSEREWVAIQIELAVSRLQLQMPPEHWRRRIRKLEKDILRCAPDSVMMEEPDSSDEYPSR